ncbi:hypothetical protein SAMN05444920_109151 [Nonomuraea solani]|uniref:SMP-30/Gluconolaconase/LRE-like region-containing protein n=1 Tax=Nonomuraea solani TaxID=1144553 RepID=A0A1H6ED83_9ACTN|nr:hypothetical protein [Nonomuraea solani]SEG95767.1 hypothetical protein SAMN05444920_109151 [Nonomuraea solani]
MNRREAESLVRARPLWGSNGMAFGPDGRLYVAQFLAGRISAVDLATGDVEIEAGSLPVASATGPEPALFIPPGLPGLPRPFAGIAATADGSLVIAANGDGGAI